jgi:hypothetical protein
MESCDFLCAGIVTREEVFRNGIRAKQNGGVQEERRRRSDEI